jgi:cytidine deaminase
MGMAKREKMMIHDMLERARTAMSKASAPFSNLPVGAVVRSASGQLGVGCNVGNTAYPEGCCAEATAIAALVMGGRKADREKPP